MLGHYLITVIPLYIYVFVEAIKAAIEVITP